MPELNFNNILLAQHRSAGMSISDTEHFFYLHVPGKDIPVVFSSAGATVEEIRHEADTWLEWMRITGRC